MLTDQGGATGTYNPPVVSNGGTTGQAVSGGNGGSSKSSSGSGGSSTINSPIPGLAQYGAIMAAAQQAYEQALATLNQQRSMMLQQYGYLGNVDAGTGAISNLRVNPTDPYGQYQVMLKNDANALQSAIDDSTNRGIHGGLANQNIAAAHFLHGANSALLGSNFENALFGLQQQQNAALAAEQQQITQAQLDAAIAAINAGAYDPAPSGGSGGSSGGNPNTGTPGSPGPGATSIFNPGTWGIRPSTPPSPGYQGNQNPWRGN